MRLGEKGNAPCCGLRVCQHLPGVLGVFCITYSYPLPIRERAPNMADSNSVATDCEQYTYLWLAAMRKCLEGSVTVLLCDAS